MLTLLFIALLNGGISWWNCYVTGSVWAESKALGGWIRLLAWCGAIQAAVGFSSVILIGLVLIVSGTDYLPPDVIKALVGLWYLMVIIPALGSGYCIMIHSWIMFARDRSIGNLGVTAWNTFANLYNTYQAIDGIGAAFGSVTSFFTEQAADSDDAKAAAFWIVLLLLFIALAGGILITAALIQKYAARLPLPERVHA